MRKTLTATVDVDTGTNIGKLEETITSVYPNPTTSLLNIELDKVANVIIYNIVGEKLAELNGANKYQLNVASFASGIYFVKAGEQTLKFVKK